MECTVPVEVHLSLEHADVGSLERGVTAALAQVGQALWAELLGRLEGALARPVACPACGGRLVTNGRAPRRLVTLAGEVELRRRRFRCRACAAEHVPLDAALGLEPRTQHTLGVRERGLWLATEMSYQRAVEVAAELRRWPIGRGELHRWVAEEGARLEAARAADAEAVFGERPARRPAGPRRGTVWVSAAETMVHDRATGTELEVKIGLVFDGTRRTGRDRRALTGRTLDAGTETWTAFAERFTALCTRLGVYEAERICFVSDGAASLRWIRERAFPTAVELLDWYHLVEQLRWAIGPERSDRLETALAVAGPGDAERLAGNDAAAVAPAFAGAWVDPDHPACPDRGNALGDQPCVRLALVMQRLRSSMTHRNSSWVLRLVRAVRRIAPALALSGLTRHREWDASRPAAGSPRPPTGTTTARGEAPGGAPPGGPPAPAPARAGQ